MLPLAWSRPQTRYILQCLKWMRRSGAHSIEVRPEEQARFNVRLQQRMSRTVYASGCKSWYLEESGNGTILWPGLSSQYWKDTPRLMPSEYILGAAHRKMYPRGHRSSAEHFAEAPDAEHHQHESEKAQYQKVGP